MIRDAKSYSATGFITPVATLYTAGNNPPTPHNHSFIHSSNTNPILSRQLTAPLNKPLKISSVGIAVKLRTQGQSKQRERLSMQHAVIMEDTICVQNFGKKVGTPKHVEKRKTLLEQTGLQNVHWIRLKISYSWGSI